MNDFSLFSISLPEIKIFPEREEPQGNDNSSDNESGDFNERFDSLFSPLQCDFVLTSIKREIEHHSEIQQQRNVEFKQNLKEEVGKKCVEGLLDFNDLIVLWNKVVENPLFTEDEKINIASDILICLIRNTVEGKANSKEALKTFLKNDALKKCVGQTHQWVKQVMQSIQIDLHCSSIVRFINEYGKEKTIQFLIFELEEYKNRTIADLQKQLNEAKKQSYPSELLSHIVKQIEKYRIYDLSIWNSLIKFPQYETWLQCMDTLSKDSPGFLNQGIDLLTEVCLLNFCASPKFDVRFKKCVEHLLSQKNPQQSTIQFYLSFISRLLHALNKKGNRDVSNLLNNVILFHEKMMQKHSFVSDNSDVMEKLFEIFKNYSLIRFVQPDLAESFWESPEYFIMKKYMEKGEEKRVSSVVDLILAVMRKKSYVTDDDLEHIERLSQYGYNKEEAFAALIPNPGTVSAGKIVTQLYLRALTGANWNENNKKLEITNKINSLFARFKIEDLSMWQDLIGHSIDVRCIADLLQNLELCFGDKPHLMREVISSMSHPLLVEFVKRRNCFQWMEKIRSSEINTFDDFYLKLISKYVQDLRLSRGNKIDDHISASITSFLTTFIQLFPNGLSKPSLYGDLDKLIALYLTLRPAYQEEHLTTTLLEMVIKRGDTQNHSLQAAIKEQIEKSQEFEMKFKLVKVLKQSQMPCDFLGLLKPKKLDEAQIKYVAEWIMDWEKAHDQKLESSMIQLFAKLAELHLYELFFRLSILQSHSYANKILDQLSDDGQKEILNFIYEEIFPHLNSDLSSSQIFTFKSYLDFSLELFTTTKNLSRLRMISRTVMLILSHSRLKREHAPLIESLVDYSLSFTPETTPQELALHEARMFCNHHEIIREVMCKNEKDRLKFYEFGFKVAAIIADYPYRSEGVVRVCEHGKEIRGKLINSEVWALLSKFLLSCDKMMEGNIAVFNEKGEEGVWFEGTMSAIFALFSTKHTDICQKDFELLHELMDRSASSKAIQTSLACIYNKYDHLRDQCAFKIIKMRTSKLFKLNILRALYQDQTIPIEVWRELFSDDFNFDDFIIYYELFNETCLRYMNDENIEDICSLYQLYLHQAIAIVQTLPGTRKGMSPTVLHILESVRQLSERYQLKVDADFLNQMFTNLLKLFKNCEIEKSDDVLILKYYFVVLKNYSPASIFKNGRLDFLQYNVKAFELLLSKIDASVLGSEIRNILYDWYQFSLNDILPTFNTPYTREEEKLLLMVENCYHLSELPFRNRSLA